MRFTPSPILIQLTFLTTKKCFITLSPVITRVYLSAEFLEAYMTCSSFCRCFLQTFDVAIVFF